MKNVSLIAVVISIAACPFTGAMDQDDFTELLANPKLFADLEHSAVAVLVQNAVESEGDTKIVLGAAKCLTTLAKAGLQDEEAAMHALVSNLCWKSGKKIPRTSYANYISMPDLPPPRRLLYPVFGALVDLEMKGSLRRALVSRIITTFATEKVEQEFEELAVCLIATKCDYSSLADGLFQARCAKVPLDSPLVPQLKRLESKVVELLQEEIRARRAGP